MSENGQEKRETPADIVVLMRHDAELCHDIWLNDPNNNSQSESICEILNGYADRIEAAWRREKAEAEADALSVGGIVEAARHKECGTPTTEKSLAVGNAAAMREALATLRKRFDNNTMAYQDRYFKFSGWHWHKKAKEAARWRDVFHELREVCDAALSAPAPTTEKSSAVGNEAAMREALNDIVGIAKIALNVNCVGNSNDSDLWDIIDKCKSALSAPPRQCDVGTAEEQTERYRKFCFAHRYLGSDFSYTCKGFGKGKCPFFESHTKSKCEFAWAQTPYDAQEGGAK